MILKQARKLVVFVIGGTVLLLGVIMLITPGQGILTIVAGLAILATEFVWARVLLNRVKEQTRTMAQHVADKWHGNEKPPPPDEP
jgi:uncharacterized protein (TIGR02611 family)